MTGRSGALALALSSSTGVISAAIGTVGSVDPRAGTTLTTDRRHAEEISPLIQKLLADSGATLADLDLLIVDRGPGRFTGLRVGLATIKTLAFALGVPVVPMSSLEILAAVAHSQTGGGVGQVTAVIDARRNEVFQQRFRPDLAPVAAPEVGPAEVLAGRAIGLVVGDGLDRYLADYEAADLTDARLITGVEVDAAAMLTAADRRAAVAGTEIEPLYLRDPDVNPNVKTRPRV